MDSSRMKFLESYVDRMDREIREDKVTFISKLDSMINLLVYNKQQLEKGLDNSMSTGSLNSLGILQRQGQMVESQCMELVTKTKSLSAMRKIITKMKGE